MFRFCVAFFPHGSDASHCSQVFGHYGDLSPTWSWFIAATRADSQRYTGGCRRGTDRCIRSTSHPGRSAPRTDSPQYTPCSARDRGPYTSSPAASTRAAGQWWRGAGLALEMPRLEESSHKRGRMHRHR